LVDGWALVGKNYCPMEYSDMKRRKINESTINILILRGGICNIYDLAFCLGRIK
tara:strand:- start:86 stop:247 length:162 start_codon:yes stop_codon:yes gene_type:complete